ncbi:winged helix-turn-helix transcriptional regulator [Rhizobiales bacterium]|uniref:MarR family winged helix-turn-helix transcriptional regulator n=1 Tax=Hongsoonwoonella zoysiae TaxID=2821844 RepID=UPI001560BD9B|nr:MarR family winged helix-turn-helix transcriptional regulator [Hongsoonwoonella zoysiae]NRG18617.1 winged helix-turn-helix transcriptional regulator [Hongsoonwoonella zoysiae]
MNRQDQKGGSVPLELENFLPYRLNVLAETVSQSLARFYESRFGIAIPEWRVVATLGQYARMTAKDIGAHSRMHKTKVSRAVASLENKNLVKRQPNIEDMRESFLELTSKGKKVYAELTPDALAFSRALVASLSPEEQKSLERILERLTETSFQLADQMLQEKEKG